jgi:hypothetical protein
MRLCQGFASLLGGFFGTGFRTGCAIFTTISLSKDKRVPHLIIEWDEIAPDSFRSFIFNIVGKGSRWVNKLRKSLCITGRRREWLVYVRVRGRA